MVIDHHGSVRGFSTTLAVPSKMRTHTHDIFVFVSSEEGVAQTSVKHVHKSLNGSEYWEMMRLKLIKGWW